MNCVHALLAIIVSLSAITARAAGAPAFATILLFVFLALVVIVPALARFVYDHVDEASTRALARRWHRLSHLLALSRNASLPQVRRAILDLSQRPAAPALGAAIDRSEPTCNRSFAS
jgi:hypothetical protein